MELTDLETCKRIAEIEGLDFTDTNQSVFYEKDFEKLRFNPLTDDALCFKLLIKYNVTFDYYIEQGVKYFFGYIEDENDNVISIPDCDSLNKFICLAIIEANKS